jgi:PadR family transcriptional regulator, regulatory protein PadR
MNDQHQFLYNGLIRMHILHHAAHEEIFGLGIIAELKRHGYELGPGTLYPMLHRLEERGYLVSRLRREGRRSRRTYRATAAGRAALKDSKAKIWELFAELFDEGRNKS